MFNQIFQNTVLSPHATKRIQQRGIKEESVKLIVEYTDRQIPVKNGCTSLTVSKSLLNKLVKTGTVRRQVSDKIRKIVVIVEDDDDYVTEKIKTVLHATHAKGRHYTKSVKRKFNRGNKHNSTRRN